MKVDVKIAVVVLAAVVVPAVGPVSEWLAGAAAGGVATGAAALGVDPAGGDGRCVVRVVVGTCVVCDIQSSLKFFIMETRMGVRPSRRKRRIVLVIGLVILGLMLAALIGLHRAGNGSAARPQRGGLNSALPAAHFGREKPLDKLGLYEKADRDSARRSEREDVFGRLSMPASTAADSSAGRLMGQLDRLKQLVRPPATLAPGVGLFRPGGPEPTSREQLEGMLRRMHLPDTVTPDPRLDRLSGMLDKIVRIQRGSAGTADTNKPVAAAIPMEKPVEEVTWDEGGFYGLDDEEKDTGAVGNAFDAVIPEAQVLVAGATIGLRLLEPARIGRVTVPADELLYGKAALSGDRLLVTINSVRVGSGVYPVALQVYDLDGMAGIHVPGAITRDVLKQSAAGGVGGLGIVTADGSLGAQAAEAGIETAKTLFSRKVALVRVTIPAGYHVLLRNQSLNKTL
jgi:hypothetical protein